MAEMQGRGLVFGEFRLNRQERALIGPDGPVEFSARSFDILLKLLSHPNEIVGKDALMDAAWPGVAVEENTLHVHVSALRKVLGPALIATVHGRGYKYTGPPPSEAVSSVASIATPTRKPVIAVLPFDNLSGDPGQQYFSDGITGDITDRLTRFRMLAVIGQHSASVFRGSAPDFAAIRTRLKADFVVTGSIRRASDRIRVAVRLSDAVSETAIWAEHYDRPPAELFDLQDEVTNLVAATIFHQLEIEVTSRSGEKPPASLTSYEYLLQGQWHFNKLSRPANDAALACFNRAVELDPRNAEALAWLAMGQINRWCTDFSADDVRIGVALAAEAIERDPFNARCHMTCGFGQIWTDGIEAARKSIDRSLALNPGESNVYANLALVSAYDGELAEARRWLDRGHTLNPIPPLWFAEFWSIVDFADGRYAEALPGVEAIPDGAWDMMYALSCYGHLGLVEKAKACLARLRVEGRSPDFLAAAAREPYRDTEHRDRLQAGIRKALSF